MALTSSESFEKLSKLFKMQNGCACCSNASTKISVCTAVLANAQQCLPQLCSSYCCLCNSAKASKGKAVSFMSDKKLQMLLMTDKITFMYRMMRCVYVPIYMMHYTNHFNCSQQQVCKVWKKKPLCNLDWPSLDQSYTKFTVFAKYVKQLSGYFFQQHMFFS